MEKISLIFDGMNILIPSLCVNPIYNSNGFNVFPIVHFLRKIFHTNINTLDYYGIEKRDANKFERLIKSNAIDLFFSENIDVYVVFDFGADIARRKIRGNYKEFRKSRRKLSLKEDFENDIVLYRNILSDLLTFFGYKVIIIPFVEGDAVIYYLSQQIKTKCVIISNDYDIIECISNKNIIYNHKTDMFIDDSIKCRNDIFLKLKYIDREYIFLPSLKNISYFKALRGDPSDGIKVSLRKNLFKYFFNFLIKNKIEFINSLDELIKLLNESVKKFDVNKVIENFSLVSLEYYINNQLRPNDIVYLEKVINKEGSRNPENIIKTLDEMELTDYNFGWVF